MHEVSPSDRHTRGGCGEARADAAQRCAQAYDARAAHEAALQRGRELRRRLTAARHALDQANETADPRRRQEAKDRARTAYQGEHATAADDRSRADAAARWGRVVDTLNREARKAVRAQGQARQTVSALEGDLRAADGQEQSLRVTAEAAEAACLEARVRLATCEERAVAPEPATLGAPATVAAVGAAPLAPGGPVIAGLGGRGAVAGVTATIASSSSAPPIGVQPARAGAAGHANGGPTRDRAAGAADPLGRPSEAAGGHGSQPQRRVGHVPTVIEALLSGDRRWLGRIASLVAETVGRPASEVFARLHELLEALSATAGSHGYVMLDSTHEFWSRLTGEESRDVLAALARLGFQFEPGEGWHADRAPVQSDLSMALAYAGLDARSLRHLPTNAQLRELPRSISVDARALLAHEAPDLALDQVVRMLGHGADPLGALWDDWGHVRPILLSDPRTLA